MISTAMATTIRLVLRRQLGSLQYRHYLRPIEPRIQGTGGAVDPATESGIEMRQRQAILW
jgi:hypothetical protein